MHSGLFLISPISLTNQLSQNKLCCDYSKQNRHPEQIKTLLSADISLYSSFPVFPFLALETWERKDCAGVGTAVLLWLQYLPERHSMSCRPEITQCAQTLQPLASQNEEGMKLGRTCLSKPAWGRWEKLCVPLGQLWSRGKSECLKISSKHLSTYSWLRFYRVLFAALQTAGLVMLDHILSKPMQLFPQTLLCRSEKDSQSCPGLGESWGAP